LRRVLLPKRSEHSRRIGAPAFPPYLDDAE
jgi:hypothetical protein